VPSGHTGRPGTIRMIPVNETTPDIERARTEEMARIERRFLDVERARVADAAQAEDAAQAGSVLTEEERARVEERALADARDLMLMVARYRRDVSSRTDEELIAEVPRNPHIRNPLELTRRLIDSSNNLRSELARSRESSERMTAVLGDQIGGLTGELVEFRTSSDRLAGRVLWWTRVLAGLTVALFLGTAVLIWLTVVLVQRTAPSPVASTPSPAHASPSISHASQAARPTPARSSAKASTAP